MRRLLDDVFCQPTRAFVAGLQVLGYTVEGMQIFDAIISRMVHTLSRPARLVRAEPKQEAHADQTIRERCCG